MLKSEHLLQVAKRVYPTRDPFIMGESVGMAAPPRKGRRVVTFTGLYPEQTLAILAWATKQVGPVHTSYDSLNEEWWFEASLDERQGFGARSQSHSEAVLLFGWHLAAWLDQREARDANA